MREGKLGDFINLAYGKGLPARTRKEGSIPVFGSSGIIDTYSEALVEGPGIVVGRKGTIGAVHWSDGDFYPIDTTYYVSLKSKGLVLRYLYFLLQTLPLQNMNTDVAVPGLNRFNALRLEISIPSVVIQEQIVGILSAYDDLIENNRRRIALLEEAARLLYREWLIHLRFPGHEQVAVVDGVPAGWAVRKIGEVAPLNYGKGLRKDDRMPGPYPVYGSSGIIDSHDEALVAGPGIIVGRKGNVGSVFWSGDDFYPIDTVYYVEPDCVSFLIYYALLHTSFISTDVAVPGLNRSYAHSRTFVIPPNSLHRLFEETVQPFHRQIAILTQQIQNLARARDLLLPRLMSGEIAV